MSAKPLDLALYSELPRSNGHIDMNMVRDQRAALLAECKRLKASEAELAAALQYAVDDDADWLETARAALAKVKP